jgi:hypothetical protein
MTGLAEKRRWINISRVDQAYLDSKQGSYKVVVPGSFAEGSHVASGVVNCPWFRETTAHLTQKEIYPLLQEETDVELLKNLALVEQYTGKRESIVKMIDARVKALTEAKPNGNTPNPPNSQS